MIALSEHTHLELKGAGLAPMVSVLCPGYVDTNILTSARNRPAELSNSGPEPSGPEVEFFMQWFSQQLKQGLSPRAVGDCVLQAIRDECFYIFPSPEWVPMVDTRLKRIVGGENPTLIPPPGMKALFG